MAIDCVTVKDRILGQLNEVWENPMEFCKLSERVLDMLKMTDGIWNELGYSYKAQEICNKIADNVRQMSQNTNHAAISNRLGAVYDEARTIGDHFYRLQSDRFCDAMGVTDPQIRVVSRMTNLELAS
jgi:hypothetical protein